MLFERACRKASLDPTTVWTEIQNAPVKVRSGNQLNFENWNSSVLADFIVQHHHGYVRESIPRIQELVDKVCMAHGDSNPELLHVRHEFNELADELLHHLPKEEQVLFPAIKGMEGQSCSINKDSSSYSLAMPIEIMEHEHEQAGTLIKSIRSRTNQYTPPSYACPTFRLTFTMLEEFDNDLMQHIHLENNILFPRFKAIL